MNLIKIEQIDDKNTLITDNGVKLTISNHMVTGYLQSRQDIIELGEAGAIAKWRREENKARQKAGLPKANKTQPLHYGTKDKAACGVERGVEGNIRQEVLWHTLSRRKVSCKTCLEKMGAK